MSYTSFNLFNLKMYNKNMSEQNEANRPKLPPPNLIVHTETKNGRPQQINIMAVNRLFVDMEQYNEQFSMGGIMARGLSSMFRGEDSGESIGRENDNQQITAEVLSAIHADTLSKIGLTLEPVHGGATFMGLGQEASSGEMRMNVSDGKQFVSFLHVLQPDVVKETGLKQNLAGLSGILGAQLLKYDLAQPNDDALQLFGNLGRIIDEYKRLGMGESVNQLAIYLQHAREGNLREFVAIDRNGYLSEPGQNFGPADWQLDSTPEYLKGKWNKAIDTLNMCKSNPKAKDLYEQLHSHLLKCVKVARGNMERIEERGGYTPENREEMRRILEEAHMQIEDLMITE